MALASHGAKPLHFFQAEIHPPHGLASQHSLRIFGLSCRRIQEMENVTLPHVLPHREQEFSLTGNPGLGFVAGVTMTSKGHSGGLAYTTHS